ncbi:MAG: SocA family protein [Rhodospirillales bacterium]|nr:MAG: SocA family protein [Rhodospirillales bacterium]
MSLHPLVAAREVCEVRGWNVSNLEIQKILYLAHMTFLGRSEGKKRLVSEHFEAWDYGPVLPTVYHRAKAFGNGPVKNVFVAYPRPRGGAEAEMIQEAVESLEDKTPGELVAITHWHGGAWAKHYASGGRGIVIPNADILDEYHKRVRRP